MRVKSLVIVVLILLMMLFASCSIPNYDIVYIDYITVTNSSQTIGAKELREGEEFLGLVLENIETSHLVVLDGNEENALAFISATFSGDIIVSGYLNVPDFGTFTAHEEYKELFPQIYNAVRDVRFRVRNNKVLLDFFEVENTVDLLDDYRMMKAIELTLIIDEYTINRFDELNMPDLVNVVKITAIN